MTIPVETIHPYCGKRLREVLDPAAYLMGTDFQTTDIVFCNGCARNYPVTDLELDISGTPFCPSEKEGVQCEYPLGELVVVKGDAQLRELRRKATPLFPF